MVRVGINGATGRMGKRLIALGHEDPRVELVSATVSAKSEHLGHDAGEIAGVGKIGLPVTSNIVGNPQAVIDFSSAVGAKAALDHCRESGVALVVASTGLSPELQQQVRDAGKTIPVCLSPNMSLAVNLTMKLAEVASRALSSQSNAVDVEIIERHHRFKADAPSGTALRFGEVISNAMGQTQHQHGRHGDTGQRPPTQIGYHAVRVGDDPGQHTIIFGMLGELLELRVAASSRDCYALGAYAAAIFLSGKPAGCYTMADVLGI
ncbi:MAG: 4-hydroxy-tetrahydrodipicolinate reductase [Pirellulaceae bacterium]